jgi:DNA end-binding protein Ku
LRHHRIVVIECGADPERADMAKLRSIFNGVLRVGEVGVAVKLYSAVEPRRVSFRLLHGSDRVPVRQRMVSPQTGEEVETEQIRKGLALPGGMVVLRDEELAELAPEPSQELEVRGFVEPGALSHPWFARPYYLGPGGEEADKYSAFVQGLRLEGKHGLVRWTMRKKVYRGVLLPIGEALALISLRTADEVVATDALPQFAWPAPSTQELAMARQLIGMLEAEPGLDQFIDHYAEQVAALAEAKAAGRPAQMPAAKPERARPASLAEALAASLAQIEEQRVA